jgi:ABC-type transport system involved in cytochrome bd biosynthesis fused ATPase/permease subunit
LEEAVDLSYDRLLINIKYITLRIIIIITNYATFSGLVLLILQYYIYIYMYILQHITMLYLTSRSFMPKQIENSVLSEFQSY